MSDSELVKILLLGPPASGKSTIANFLSADRDRPGAKYYETNPLRILETHLDLEATKLQNRRIGNTAKWVRVQLWDLGGSSKHQACWPAVAQNANGVIFVFNPEIRNSERELLLWHKNFVMNQHELNSDGTCVQRVPDKNCLIFAHHSTQPTGGLAIPTMPKGLNKIKVLETSLDYHSENFKEAFDKLVESIILARMEAEENQFLEHEKNAPAGPKLHP